MKWIKKELLKKDTCELKLEEILSFALTQEIKAQKLYEKINENNIKKSLESVLDRLIEEEKFHESKIRSIFNDFFPDKDIEAFDMELKEDFSNNTEIMSEGYTVNELLERGIEKEKNSSELYQTIAERVDEEAVSNLLSYLVYMENEHRSLLQIELSDRI